MTILRSHSPDDTLRLGRILGEVVAPGDVIGLVGPLGSGKTLFSQGVAIAGLEVPPAQAVTSPTYTIINTYYGRFPIAHIDLYRLGGVDEMAESGVLDHLGSEFVSLLEWFDRCERYLRRYLRVDFVPAEEPNHRGLHLRALGSAHEQLMTKWLHALEHADSADHLT